MTQVSCILPNYNDGYRVAKTVETILLQGIQELEIILIDDGSTDDSITYIQPLADKEPRIVFYRNPYNIGVVPTLIKGIALARGEYLYMGSCNDSLLPGFFTHALRIFHAHPECHLVAANSYLRFPHTMRLSALGWGDKERFFSPHELLQHSSSFLSSFHGQSCLLRRRALPTITPIYHTLRWTFDLFFFFSIALQSGFYFLPTPYAHIEMSPRSFSAKGGTRKEQINVISAFLTILDQPDHAMMKQQFMRSGLLIFMGFSLFSAIIRTKKWHFLSNRLLINSIKLLLQQCTATQRSSQPLPQLWSMAPYFFDDAGHDAAYHQAVQTAFQTEGYHTLTFAATCCTSNTPILPFFHHARYRLLLAALRLWDYSRLLYRSSRDPAPRHILLLESYTLLDLGIFTMALWFLAPPSLEVWHIWRDGLEWAPKKQKLHIWIASLSQRMLKQRYRPFSDSTIAIQSLAPLLQQTMTLLPIPHTPSAKTCSQLLHRERQTLRLWAPGRPRWEKGIQVIQQFLRSPDSALEQMELWIAPSHFLNASHTTSISRIHWLSPNLPRADYVQLFDDVDALILPYDPLLYRSRTSGPFVEAIAANKPTFVRRGSWLANELLRYQLEEYIIDWTSSQAPSALLAAYSNSQATQKRHQMSLDYGRFHTMDTFQKTLLQNQPCHRKQS